MTEKEQIAKLKKELAEAKKEIKILKEAKPEFSQPQIMDINGKKYHVHFTHQANDSYWGLTQKELIKPDNHDKLLKLATTPGVNIVAL